MSHITLSCNLSVKIDFSLDSEDQEKKGLHFLEVDKRSKMANLKMAAKVYKNKHIYE